MSTTKFREYEQKDFSHLRGLTDITDAQLDVHFGLYAGYVKNTNLCNKTIAELTDGGKAGTPEYAEINRRLGFEYNGMRLHEYYFENLASAGKGEPGPMLKRALEDSFGTFDNWKKDFYSVASMRGIGWVILYLDPLTGRCSNHWITEHENGHPAGFEPVLVMDMWEHAYMVDRKPADKKKYVDAFFANIDWEAVERRMA
jgi:Fe-Mn family superoxide dismutase